MWVFCCGMPRSGSTVQYQITANLVEDSGLGKRVEWRDHFDFPEIRDKYAGYHGWKVFKVHIPTKDIIEEFKKENAIGIYIFRDIRDAITSNIRKKRAVSDPNLRKNLVKRWSRNWITYYDTWTRLPGVLVSKYEDSIPSLLEEVRRIAEHLGISMTETGYQNIAAELTLEKQLARIEEIKKGLSNDNSRDEATFDPHSLLHIDHIHSAEIGGWKVALTGKEIARIERKTKRWLLNNGYELSAG